MDFFHMQMHPDEEDQRITGAIAGINLGFIGLDFDISKQAPILATKSLDEWQPHEFNEATQAHITQHQSPGPTKVLRQFHDLKLGDVGLIRGGATPIALVRIKGAYQFEPNPPDGRLWFRHRFPIDVIEMYDDYIRRDSEGKFTPPAPGAFQLLTGNSSTENAIKRWYASALGSKKENQMKELLQQSKQMILYGPPGTGKTRRALELTASTVGELIPNSGEFAKLRGTRWNIVQFHAAYNYEDFVRGIKVITQNNQVAYVTQNGILGEMAEQASQDPSNPYVLIIDEINRANLAGVLGELIYALEYRNQPVDTPYELPDKGRSITVPPNLYIIGTMNTADRSIGHIDYAIRRRFAFADCLPSKAALVDFYTGKDAELKFRAISLFDSVSNLFTDSSEHAQVMLSHDFSANDVQLGHSYFLAHSSEELSRKLTYQVKPILYEYLRDGVLMAEAKTIIDSLN